MYSRIHGLLVSVLLAPAPVAQEPEEPPAEGEHRVPDTAAQRVRAATGCDFAVIESKIRRNLISTDTPYGFKVADVDAGSPAEKAGIEAGWILLKWAGHPIHELEELDRWLWTLPAGGEVKVGYSRKKKDVSILSRAPWESGEVELVIRREHPLRARWGIDVFAEEDFEPPADPPDGVWIHGVDEGSPAARGGLLEGDVITSWNGLAVPDPDALRRAFLQGLETDEQKLVVARRLPDASEWRDHEIVLKPVDRKVR